MQYLLLFDKCLIFAYEVIIVNILMKKFMVLTAILMICTSCFAMDTPETEPKNLSMIKTLSVVDENPSKEEDPTGTTIALAALQGSIDLQSLFRSNRNYPKGISARCRTKYYKL